MNQAQTLPADSQVCNLQGKIMRSGIACKGHFAISRPDSRARTCAIRISGYGATLFSLQDHATGAEYFLGT